LLLDSMLAVSADGSIETVAEAPSIAVFSGAAVGTVTGSQLGRMLKGMTKRAANTAAVPNKARRAGWRGSAQTKRPAHNNRPPDHGHPARPVIDNFPRDTHRAAPARRPPLAAEIKVCMRSSSSAGTLSARIKLSINSDAAPSKTRSRNRLALSSRLKRGVYMNVRPFAW